MASSSLRSRLLAHPASRSLAEAAGGRPVHLVGGVIRDALLGRQTKDIDAVIAGGGEEAALRMARLLPARLVRLGGQRFAAYRLVADDFTLDLWDRRETSLRDDLARRDFTLNAIALPIPRPGGETVTELIDPFGGLADLARRRLRAVTTASFEGDPLRVLRLTRLALRLGLEVVPDTLALARAAAPRLLAGRPASGVAAERVRDELRQIFADPPSDLVRGRTGGERAVRLLAASGVYPALWQPTTAAGGQGAQGGGASRAEVTEKAGTAPQRRPASEIVARATRALAALEAVAREHGRALRAFPGGLDLSPARWAVTFLALVPATPTEARATGPEREAFESFVEAGFLAGREAAAVERLLRWAGARPRGRVQRRVFLHEVGKGSRRDEAAASATTTAAAAVALVAGLERAWGGTGEEKGERTTAEASEWETRELAGLLRSGAEEGAEIFDPPRWVSGDDARALTGLEPGPRLGEALRALRRAQVEGSVTDRRQAEVFLRRWAEGGEALSERAFPTTAD